MKNPEIFYAFVIYIYAFLKIHELNYAKNFLIIYISNQQTSYLSRGASWEKSIVGDMKIESNSVITT